MDDTINRTPSTGQFAAKTKAEPEGIVTLSDAAGFVGIHVDQLRNIIKLGYIAKTKPGYVDLRQATQGLIKYYKDRVNDATRNASRNRLADGRAEEIQMRLAEKRRELVPLEDAIASSDIVCATCRDEILGLASRCTRDLPMRRTIEAEVNASLTRIADKLARAAQFLREGGSLPLGFDDD